jgi:hypothetical protein
MTIWRHLDFNSVVCRSPDEPAAEPVLEPAPEPAPTSEPVAEPVAEPAPESAPPTAAALTPAPERMVSAKIFEKTAFELREDRRQANARAEAAEKRANDFQAIIERLQAGNPDPSAPSATPRTPAPAAPTDFQAAVRAQSAADRLKEDSLAVLATGQQAFGDFGQSLSILTAVGALSDDIVSDLIAIDKTSAHIIIDKLAKDPEKAASLVTMDSRRRIAELTRMTVVPAAAPQPAPAPAVAAPAAPAISRAPAPAPRVAPVAQAQDVDPTTPDGNEKMSDAQWEKWAKSQGVDGLLKRRA